MVLMLGLGLGLVLGSGLGFGLGSCYQKRALHVGVRVGRRVRVRARG